MSLWNQILCNEVNKTQSAAIKFELLYFIVQTEMLVYT